MSVKRSRIALAAILATIVGAGAAFANDACSPCAAPVAPIAVTPTVAVMPAPIPVEPVASNICGDPCAPVMPAPAPAPVMQTNACDPCAPVMPAPAPGPVYKTNACNPCAPAVSYCDPCGSKKGRSWRWFGWFRPAPRNDYSYNHRYHNNYRYY